MSEADYHRLPERPIYKSYPVYAPGREPPGYYDRLRRLEPELAFDAAALRTQEDWLRAGAVVFEAPVEFPPKRLETYETNASWFTANNVPVAADGTVPFYRYVVRNAGTVELGTLACANCHTRVLPGGVVVPGAPGNFPRSKSRTYVGRRARSLIGEPLILDALRTLFRRDYAAPWLTPDPNHRTDNLSLDQFLEGFEAMPAGVMPSPATSFFAPVQVPDLIGVRDRRYLDHTGYSRHRDVADLMRYAASIQGGGAGQSGGHPVQPRPPGPIGSEPLMRYSDAQLYALAQYVYSLRPPDNPNVPATPEQERLVARGRELFDAQRCADCHAPPLYTNNKLTLAVGFTALADHPEREHILPESVHTDPTLALATRKGTGLYKVPSLRGLWHRGPFGHGGWCATLEDWFDPRRLRDDHVPTGFKGAGVKTRAVPGHPFGLDLGTDDRRALIAFLKTL
jgi:hypothetical protein